MATLYYDNATEDGNWATLGNWRLDDFTGTRVPATGLPTSSDSVVVKAAVTSNTGTQPTVVNLRIEYYAGETWTISITVTGLASLFGNVTGGVEGNCWITGNVEADEFSIFYCYIFGNLTMVGGILGDGVYVNENGSFSGTELLSGSSVNGYGAFVNSAICGGGIGSASTFSSGAYLASSGLVLNQATFAAGTYNEGYVSGDATFTDANNYGIVTDEAEFIRGSNADNGSYQGTVEGKATFRVSATNANNCTVNNAEFFSDGINYGSVSFDATFHDVAINTGTVYGNATFNGTAVNDSLVMGEATFNDSSYNNSSLMAATFNDSAYNAGVISGATTFNNTSYNNGSVESEVTFNDASSNNSGVTGNATFNESSRIGVLGAYVIGNVTFRGNSYNVNGISGTITAAHGGCINGSSILGVV
jgi:hypothetical protein